MEYRFSQELHLQSHLQEGLLALLEHYVVAEIFGLNDELGVGDLFAVHGKAALLYCAEAFAVGGDKACLLYKGHYAYAFSRNADLLCGDVRAACAAAERRPCSSR